MRERVINKRLVGFVFERACFKKNLLLGAGIKKAAPYNAPSLTRQTPQGLKASQ